MRLPRFRPSLAPLAAILVGAAVLIVACALAPVPVFVRLAGVAVVVVAAGLDLGRRYEDDVEDEAETPPTSS